MLRQTTLCDAKRRQSAPNGYFRKKVAVGFFLTHLATSRTITPSRDTETVLCHKKIATVRKITQWWDHGEEKMSYQTFTSIEELLEHVKNNVKELDGKFAVSESVDLFEQLDKKSSDHKKSITEKEALEKRARAAEAKLKEVEPKVAEYEAEIQHLKDTTPTDEKVRELTNKLKKESTARAEFESRNRELSDQVKELAEIKQEFDEMRGREQRRIIMSEIRKIGSEIKIPQSVLNDDALLERWFTPDLKLDETTGKVWAEGDVPIKSYLLSKQKEKPDLLEPRSNGAGGGPGQSTHKSDGFSEASKRYLNNPRSGLNGIADMIANAPTAPVE